MGLKEPGLRGSLRNVSVGINTIPDSVVSREPDNDSFTSDGERGIRIELKSNWPSIGAKISENTENFTTAYLRNEDDELIDSKDISDLSSEDTFTFDDVNLSSGEIFSISLDAGGSGFTNGQNTGETDYPYTSDDLDVIGTYDNGSSTDNGYRLINDVGNVGFD